MTDETVDRVVAYGVRVGRHSGVVEVVVVGRSEAVGLLICLEDLWGVGEV